MSKEIVQVNTGITADITSKRLPPAAEQLETSVKVAKRFRVQKHWNIEDGESKKFSHQVRRDVLVQFSAFRDGKDMITDPSSVAIIHCPDGWEDESIQL